MNSQTILRMLPFVIVLTVKRNRLLSLDSAYDSSVYHEPDKPNET
jgi:hypothetical protein